MPTITINQEIVTLVEQDRQTFLRFTEMAYPQCVSMLGVPKERRFIGMLPASFIMQRQREAADWSDPLVQVALWNLHDLGVEEMAFGAEAADATPESQRSEADGESFVRFDKATSTDMAQGDPSAINYSTVTSGRAFIAALNNVVHRVFRMGGDEFLIGIQPRPELEKVSKMITESRQNDEGLIFATARTLGAMARLGRTPEDMEMKCAIELLSNMGCVGVAVDPDAGRMTFTNFSLMSALSSGMLQGLQWEQLKNVRKNVEAFQQKLAGGEESRIQNATLGPIGSKRRRT